MMGDGVERIPVSAVCCDLNRVPVSEFFTRQLSMCCSMTDFLNCSFIPFHLSIHIDNRLGIEETIHRLKGHLTLLREKILLIWKRKSWIVATYDCSLPQENDGH